MPIEQTNIDALQAERFRQAQINIKRHLLCQVLSVFDPQVGDQALEYLGVLRRLENVIAKELQAQGG